MHVLTVGLLGEQLGAAGWAACWFIVTQQLLVACKAHCWMCWRLACSGQLGLLGAARFAVALTI